MDEDWRSDLQDWLAPFLDVLGHKTRSVMCPAYVAGELCGKVGDGVKKAA